MLAMQGRHAEAAGLVLDELGVSAATVSGLGVEARRLVSIAATYLEKSGDHDLAADLFEALGEGERAAMSRTSRALSEVGPSSATPGADEEDDAPPTVRGNVEPLSGTVLGPTRGPPPPAGTPSVGEAPPRRSVLLADAQALVEDGQPAAAAARLAEHGLFYEASVCLIKAGELDAALAHITRVAPGDPQYHVAARTAVRVLCRRAVCEPHHLRFLRDWMVAGPADREQAELFVRFAAIVAARAGERAAETVLRAVLRRIPDHADAISHLQQILGPAEQHTVSVAGGFLEGTGPTVPPVSTIMSEELAPGMVVANRFRVDEQIGRGGMATVYSVHDLELDEQVALKVFAGQLMPGTYQQEAVERFRLELKLCRKLRHPNIIQVYDIGVFAGQRYFTMELLRGYSLDQLLGDPVETSWGIECLIQAATGLHAAHEEGVVHRDVKPENLFVTEDGVVKVMDFGIAKSTYQPGKTQIGTLAGTPEYMAPEQINNFSLVGPPADQYSLGCVAYQMFTGCVPFASDQMMAVLMAHIERQPTPPRELNPALPPLLEAVILRMLAKRPQDRFTSTWEVAETLARLRENG